MKSFIIDHIDPLGQGVFKENEDIYFIPKTLPFESGSFQIIKSKKNIHFCEVLKMDKISENRITPECPHFERCSGCHFLHTDYNHEIEFKLSTFKRKLSYLTDKDLPEIDVIESPKRLHYRNRIQLHYSLKSKRIGFMKYKSKEIQPVDKCQIMDPQVKEAYDKLLKNDQWINLAKAHKKPEGHVELYNSANEVQVNWNSKYSAGGFTQVFEEMNQKLNLKVNELTTFHKGAVLDLFAGGGNLSKEMPHSKKVIVDIYDHVKTVDQYSINLFKENALENFTQSCAHKNFSTIVIDPPRSGFNQIDSWVQSIKPKEVIYVSCHPDTMIRDLKSMSDNYKITYIALLDLFPSTFHFESLVKLEAI